MHEETNSDAIDLTDSSAELAASHLRGRISSAMEQGVGCEIDVFENGIRRTMPAEAADLSVEGTALFVETPEGRIGVPFAGADACAVLPEIRIMDASEAMRGRVMDALAGMLVGETAGGAVAVSIDGTGNPVEVTTCSAIAVNSQGVFPPWSMGMEWSEVVDIEVIGDAMTLKGADRSLEIILA
jgi:hypothetical protein